MSKKRLDLLVQRQLPQLSRTKIASLIMQGKVRADDRVITKVGTPVDELAVITCDITEPPFVSRAGEKLAHALAHFAVNPQGLIVLDSGISTGGFTDCLLQAGAVRVYGVDVGYGIVHEKIRKDPRVILFERTNLRNLERLPEKVDLVTLDLSFISVLKVMPAVIKLMKDDGRLIVLIKPQFEAERTDISRGGIVKDAAVHERVIKHVIDGIQKFGLQCVGVTPSSVRGADGNQEFLAYFTH